MPEKEIIREVGTDFLDEDDLRNFLKLKTKGRPELEKMSWSRIAELSGLQNGNHPTKAGLLLFGFYPQLIYPELMIAASSYLALQKGENPDHIRFLDNLRIEGTLSEMAKTALSFVRRNLRQKTVITGQTVQNRTELEIPESVIREAIVNALLHRDYSDQATAAPIRLEIYPDRLEISNPGTVYGGISLDTLASSTVPVRNPILVTSFELMNQTENRGTGILTMQADMKKAGLPEPQCMVREGSFKVTLFRPELETGSSGRSEKKRKAPDRKEILEFCQTPKTRKELTDHFGYSSPTSFIQSYIMPLIETGEICLTDPDHFSSRKQKFFTSAT